MKKKIIAVSVLFLSLLLTGSAVYQSKESSKFEELKNIIEPLNEQIFEAQMNEDLELFLDLLTDDVTLMPPFKPVLKGKEAVTANWIHDKSQGVKLMNCSASIKDLWESDGMIYERGEFRLSLKHKDSTQLYAIVGSYFTVWEKQPDGSYKTKYDISNLNHKVK